MNINSNGPEAVPPTQTSRTVAAVQSTVREVVPPAVAAAASAAASGSMGIKGVFWSNVLNTSAIGLISVLFVWILVRGPEELERERQLYRDSWAGMDRRMDRVVEEQRLTTMAVHGMTLELRNLAQEVRRSNDMQNIRNERNERNERKRSGEDDRQSMERAPMPKKVGITVRDGSIPSELLHDHPDPCTKPRPDGGGSRLGSGDQG